jgi:hypothetical protein
MYLIVILLLQSDSYKTISDPTLYTSMYECETARAVVNSKLMGTRPTESASVFSQCTELSIKDKAANDINL